MEAFFPPLNWWRKRGWPDNSCSHFFSFLLLSLSFNFNFNQFGADLFWKSGSISQNTGNKNGIKGKTWKWGNLERSEMVWGPAYGPTCSKMMPSPMICISSTSMPCSTCEARNCLLIKVKATLGTDLQSAMTYPRRKQPGCSGQRELALLLPALFSNFEVLCVGLGEFWCHLRGKNPCPHI